MQEMTSAKRPGRTMRIFDTFEQAEAFEWSEVLARPKPWADDSSGATPSTLLSRCQNLYTETSESF